MEELQTRVSRGGITETTAQLPPYSGPGPGPNMRHVRQALRGRDLVDTFSLFFDVMVSCMEIALYKDGLEM